MRRRWYANAREIVGSGTGDGATVVLAHGYGVNQESCWGKIMPSIVSQASKVILFDWDFTTTAHHHEEEDCFTFGRFADDLIELMDEKNVRGAVLVGHSMSAMVACIASKRRPELFAQLILLCASPRCPQIKMPTAESLRAELSSKTPPFGLRLWIVIGISIWVVILCILGFMCFWSIYRRKPKKSVDKIPVSQIPDVSKEIAVDEVRQHAVVENYQVQESHALTVQEKSQDKDSGKMLGHLVRTKSSDADNLSQCSSVYQCDRAGSSYSGDEGSSGNARRQYSQYATVSASPLVGLPEFSHLGWGHWFTLRDLEHSTNRFSKENIIGEGGYGVVYRGRLINGTDVAIKKLLNNMGQAEKEFRVEVEAIGHVRHKNLVRLLGYCVEGIHRMLVYEYVNNGNLEQWIHGAMRQHGVLTWEARMKIILGIAKALAYLHEAIEPKVVHRDIKSSNILIDEDFNGKLSDFGLAKLLGAGKSHVTTRVMGTFGYVAPEYANTGLLNEKSDVYSFGVLLLEAVTGRDPVDNSRPDTEVHLVEWLKSMVGSRRAEEVVDPDMEVKPTIRALKRALLVALRCVDPHSEKRPTMGHVVRMLEAEDVPSREDRRSRRGHGGNTDTESKASSSEFETSGDRRDSGTSVRFQS